MITSKTDVDQLIAAVKALPARTNELFLEQSDQINPTRHSKPQKPKPGTYNPYVDDTTLGATAAVLRTKAKMFDLPFVTRYVYLPKPFLIWPSQPNLDQFIDSGIENYGSWARAYLYAEAARVSNTISFYYFWTNESPYGAEVSIDAPMVLNGNVFGSANAAFFGGNHTNVRGMLILQPLKWTGFDPLPNGQSTMGADLGIRQAGEFLYMFYLDAYGGWGFGSPGEVSRSFAHKYFNSWSESHWVPSGASIVIKVNAYLVVEPHGKTITDQGWIDFASAGNAMVSTHVLLTVRTTI